MLTDFKKEIVDKIEEAIRLGFQIAEDHIGIGYEYNEVEDYPHIDYSWAKVKLAQTITEMRKAALGQEAA